MSDNLTPRIEQFAPELERIISTSEPIEHLADGFGGAQGPAEGPLWWKDGGYLLFSDIHNNRRMKYQPGSGVSLFLEPTNRANGLTRDLQGRLVACEHDSRRVTRQEADGSITVVANSFQGRRLNRPNVIGMFDVGVCTALALGWFKVPFRGSLVTLFICSAMFLIVVLSLGFFISVIAKNQLAASQIALIATFLPAFLLSGFLFAIEQMPTVIQYITRILPARYYVSALKKIFLKGTPTTMLYGELIPLAIFTVLLATVATRAFHKRLV